MGRGPRKNPPSAEPGPPKQMLLHTSLFQWSPKLLAAKGCSLSQRGSVRVDTDAPSELWRVAGFPRCSVRGCVG